MEGREGDWYPGNHSMTGNNQMDIKNGRKQEFHNFYKSSFMFNL